MSQLFATLYPDKYTPPKGRLMPRPKVINDKELDNTMRNLNRIDKREECFRLIQSGMTTAPEIAKAMNRTNNTINVYFKELEKLGRCYRIDRGRNRAHLMFAHPEKLREAA